MITGVQCHTINNIVCYKVKYIHSMTMHTNNHVQPTRIIINGMTMHETMPMSSCDNSINKLTITFRLKQNVVKKTSRSSQCDTLLSRSIIKRPFKKQLQWSKQAMLNAMKAVQDGLPILTAARGHSVPKTSLYNRIKGKVVHGVKPGTKQYLSMEEETELAEFAVKDASVGCGQTRKQIMSIAENIAKDKGILCNYRISQGWYEKFIGRQTYLSLCKGDPAANDRMDAVTLQAIKQYFDLLEKTLKDNNILNKLAQMYNVDETGMAYEHCGSGNKAQTTVVACVNAIGQVISLYAIYNAKTLNPDWIKDGPLVQNMLVVKMGGSTLICLSFGLTIIS